jgi:glycopeptide antibiotics resistance protein
VVIPLRSVSQPSGVSIQLGLFDAIKDLLFVHPVFFLGVVVICIMLVILFQKNPTIPKIKITILSLVFYYYLCVMLTNIVGIPTLHEFMRLSGLGESFFHPHINLIPFDDGFSLSFILNIFLFIPLGFLCPLLSKHYQRVKNTLLTGLGLSFSIEMVQLFTLYRATDIDDLSTNVVGTLVGYFCFWLIHKLVTAKSHASRHGQEPKAMRYIPIVIIVTTFVFGFFS